jgi:hypothetical protein
MYRKQSHPRTLTPDNNFTPAEIRKGDEYFVNGIFEFNITMMIENIKSNPEIFIPEKVSVSEFYNDFSVIDEEYIYSVIVDEPVILAEIAPGRYNLIDGNHRMEKAKRRGYKDISAYKLGPVQHVMFLTSRCSYEKYIVYWNEKLLESQSI